MELSDQSRSSRGPAADLWRRTLSQIPTAFGRLVYLASLRDRVTGRYTQPAMTSMLGPEDSDRTLCHSHHQVFSEWIGYSLSEQKADLDDYVRLTGSRGKVFAQYRELIPPTARDVERQLYLTDLETLLELLRYGADGGAVTPEA